jgi:hypothetical protein
MLPNTNRPKLRMTFYLFQASIFFGLTSNFLKTAMSVCIELSRECRGAHEVAEHDHGLTTLRAVVRGGLASAQQLYTVLG